MNFKENETEQKLRGAYYTPFEIADFIARWVSSKAPITILEPSCGEGVFLEAIARYRRSEEISLTICDNDPKALSYSVGVANRFNYKDVRHVEGDFVAWAVSEFMQCSHKTYDAVVGNPPFVRYQYMDRAIQDATQDLYAILGRRFTKHANLWAAFVVASLELLNPSGRFAMVLPEEIITVLYASEVRRAFEELCSKVVLVVPNDRKFENTLQGFVVLLAEKKIDQRSTSSAICVYELPESDDAWRCDPSYVFANASGRLRQSDGGKWTGLLLNEREYEVYDSLASHPAIRKFSDIATVEVGIVTGANSYFLVSDDVVERYGLQEFSRPMFGRSCHCPGVLYDERQHLDNKELGYPTNFLLFSEGNDHCSEYIDLGIENGIDLRYKCRIRTPWYKVPGVFSTDVAMLKRSSNMPRLVYNELHAYTTDTAYRVKARDGIDSRALVRCFQNSLTALSAELEGRYYGGGVLELVPSEIRRLLIPYTSLEFVSISDLDKETRSLAPESLLRRQDKRLAKAVGFSTKDMDILHRAWMRLSSRRQSR